MRTGNLHDRPINSVEENNKENIEPKNLLQKTQEFLHEILNIRDGADIDGSISGIQRDIVFKGPSLWILVFSIFIASIGLNQNSIPVVIGAMLISPLMGPILGIGLAIGTFDWGTLQKSLKFLGIAVFVSLLTSTLYFLFTPLKAASSELFARTQPTLLDVFVAIFGGFAGIIAGSRKEKTNVVPGVAIATALMPPLCTAGYGIATLQMSYFFGALYLFFINSVFISITTFLTVRYLHFPIVNFVSKVRERKIKIYMIVFIAIIILPSAKIFFNVIQESRFNYNANKYVSEVFKDAKNDIYYKTIKYSDTLSQIDIYTVEKLYTEGQIRDLTDKLKQYRLIGSKEFASPTDSTVLTIHQGKTDVDSLMTNIKNENLKLKQDMKENFFKDFYKNQAEVLSKKNERIEMLENELIRYKSDSIPLKQIISEVKVEYSKIKKIAYAKSFEADSSGKIDTIPVFLVDWKRNIYRSQIKKDSKKLQRWLKIRLNLDTVRVIKYN